MDFNQNRVFQLFVLTNRKSDKNTPQLINIAESKNQK